jgi:hypothetical protein
MASLLLIDKVRSRICYYETWIPNRPKAISPTAEPTIIEIIKPALNVLMVYEQLVGFVHGTKMKTETYITASIRV